MLQERHEEYLHHVVGSDDGKGAVGCTRIEDRALVGDDLELDQQVVYRLASDLANEVGIIWRPTGTNSSSPK